MVLLDMAGGLRLGIAAILWDIRAFHLCHFRDPVFFVRHVCGGMSSMVQELETLHSGHRQAWRNGII